MMRIGIDARMLHKAGIRRYATQLIQNLSRIDRGNDYHIYASTGSNVEELEGLGANFTLHTLDAPLFSPKEHFLLRDHIRKEKIGLLHTTFDFGVPLWSFPKVVVTVHDVFFGPVTFFKNYKTRLLYQMLTRYSVWRSSEIIVVSDYIHNKLLCYMPHAKRKADKIRVVHNGVSPEFSPEPTPIEADMLQQKYGISRRYIFCVGSFASRIKNLPGIVKAFNRLPRDIVNRFHLVIAGEASDRVPEARQVIAGSHYKDRIRCIGYVPNDDLPALYRGADVFMYPSLHEGFGIPILEAMACGTPVITSSISAMPEIAGDAALFVDPYNVRDMSDTLARACAHGHTLNGLTEKGIKRAKEFSWLNTAKRTLDIYRELWNG
jgi:glycosyltransferase involved in cell wall biosynthesis